MTTDSGQHPWWVQTWSGQAVDLLRPDPDAIRPGDIWHSLSAQVRFLGHARAPMSVAAHSELVAAIAARLWREQGETPDRLMLMAARLHDAHEAYVGDIIQPVAALPALRDDIAALKDRLQQAVHIRFGLPWPLPPTWAGVIDRADMIALATEKAALMAPEPRPWGPLPKPEPGYDLTDSYTRGALQRQFGTALAFADEPAVVS